MNYRACSYTAVITGRLHYETILTAIGQHTGAFSKIDTCPRHHPTLREQRRDYRQFVGLCLAEPHKISSVVNWLKRGVITASETYLVKHRSDLVLINERVHPLGTRSMARGVPHPTYAEDLQSEVYRGPACPVRRYLLL